MSFQNLTSKERRAAERYIRSENAKYGEKLVEIPKEKYPKAPDGFSIPVSVYRNNRFAVQIFKIENSDVLRLTINRTAINRTAINHKGDWLDGITWDELQNLKNQLFPELQAVEIYPSAGDVVNVANMRHLWLLPERLPFGWRNNSEK